MSIKLDTELAVQGTRFLVYPQPRTLKAFSKPEVVIVSVPPKDVQPGPSDRRMYVVDPPKKRPYGPRTAPPYSGKASEPLSAAHNGHFTHVKPESREFAVAAMYATVRRVLDIWEDYLGKPLRWVFAGDYDRLELLPLVKFENAQAGHGFLEFGFARNARRSDLRDAYCLNFDVLAHEFGHCMIDSLIGYPESDATTSIDYGAFHESGADLVSIVSALHFDSVVKHILDSTKGNLFSKNELSRIGELSESRELRRAFNNLKMSDVGDEPHDRSEPLTGAFFDVFVEVFQKKLVDRGLITADLAQRSTQGIGVDLKDPRFPKEFAAAYRGKSSDFKQALLEARDYLGLLLARVWKSLPPDNMSFSDIYKRARKADSSLSSGAHRKTIDECFAWREIGATQHPRTMRIRSIRSCRAH